jgi:hypothetical protein
MAPGVGQSVAQQPQYQHSSGCRMMGGWPLWGLGMKTSIWQVSTQVLQPMHFPGSMRTGVLGVGILGIAYTFLSIVRASFQGL